MTIPDNNHAYAPVAKAVPINDGALGESFISSPAETVSPDATAYLEVVAPSTLPGKSALVLFYLVNSCVRYEDLLIWLLLH